MKYRSEIRVMGDSEKILKCFHPEIRRGDRSGFDIKTEDSVVVFEIYAKDSTALRATLNSITKLLTVYEKMSDIKNG